MNQETIPQFLSESATSLLLETGRMVDKQKLLEVVLKEFEKYYERFLETGTLENLQEEYCALLVSLNKEVKVLDPKGEYVGISRGINGVGELLVEGLDGEIQNVYAGEVSVRGLYGYI